MFPTVVAAGALLPMAIEVDFTAFPPPHQVVAHTVTYHSTAADGSVAYLDPKHPGHLGPGCTAVSMAENTEAQLDGDGFAVRRDGGRLVIARYNGVPVAQFRYYTTGPVPAVRYVVRPDALFPPGDKK